MYGLLISLAIFICVLVLEKLANRKNLKSDLIWGGAPIIIVCSILGARLYHVLSAPEYYQQHPADILNISKGGLGIYGAIFAGVISGLIFFKHHKQPILQWLDIITIVLPLGQAIGRWGNFFNKELYGKETTSLLGIAVNGGDAKYHPLFIYESVLNFATFIGLYWLNRKTPHTGVITCMYLISYGTARAIIEPLRIESWAVNNINVAQSFSISFIILGLAGLVKIKYDSRKEK